MSRRPIVAVTSDLKTIDNYRWHAAIEIYMKAAAEVAGVTPLIVPALAGDIDVDALLSEVDGVLATGSRSNVHPSLYVKEAEDKDGPFDQDRDAMSLPLLKRAVERSVPVLAICRGFQELNVAFGGSLISEVHELDDRMDHRAPEHDDHDVRFGIRQKVEILPGSMLAGILEQSEITVNSLHRQAIGVLAPGLKLEAVAPDGTVEAFTVENAPGFVLGIQWHPEYWAGHDGPSTLIFEAFGDAVRAHATALHQLGSAAE